MIPILILQIAISISPIRVSQPYPHVKCPKGFELWWPDGREFENDKYAQCVKWEKNASKIVKPSGDRKQLPIEKPKR